MRQTYLISFLFFLIVNTFYSQSNDLSVSDFKGKVKTVITYLNNEREKSISYNEDGNIIDYVGYDPKTQYFNKKYDSKGRMIYYKDENFITIKNYNDSENSSFEYTILALRKDTTNSYYNQFDKTQNLLINKHTEYSNNKRWIERSTEYKYDTLNRLIKEVFTQQNADNTIGKALITYIEYFYNNGIIKKIASDGKGQEFITENFKFPSKIPLYKSIYDYYKFNNDDFIYDEKTKLTKVIKYQNKDNSLKKVLTFSGKELLLIEEDYTKEILILKTENKYDDTNNIIEKITKDYRNGKTRKNKYIITYY
ncbi:hypothetical protein [Flavobacterium reichenbachii]|uniref:Sugar-binding protein n=1 Tax=Flavobacterium reichenbachii TaxID=362418 RepID=A0A085ZEM2_9FLAO|nr:hypothetical protein [Flavobacterium reichenbachii]KFF02886.1 hypothetical protein IW19_22255 [Flavobacterium reichenbachii]OXB16879.1 hypothetical protein B0A68_05445 [Flavobacterium reichenbachii]